MELKLIQISIAHPDGMHLDLSALPFETVPQQLFKIVNGQAYTSTVEFAINQRGLRRYLGKEITPLSDEEIKWAETLVHIFETSRDKSNRFIVSPETFKKIEEALK